MIYYLFIAVIETDDVPASLLIRYEQVLPSFINAVIITLLHLGRAVMLSTLSILRSIICSMPWAISRPLKSQVFSLAKKIPKPMTIAAAAAMLKVYFIMCERLPAVATIALNSFTALLQVASGYSARSILLTDSSSDSALWTENHSASIRSSSNEDSALRYFSISVFLYSLFILASFLKVHSSFFLPERLSP